MNRITGLKRRLEEYRNKLADYEQFEKTPLNKAMIKSTKILIKAYEKEIEREAKNDY